MGGVRGTSPHKHPPSTDFGGLLLPEAAKCNRTSSIRHCLPIPSFVAVWKRVGGLLYQRGCDMIESDVGISQARF
jgi:hypothetical protein